MCCVNLKKGKLFKSWCQINPKTRDRKQIEREALQEVAFSIFTHPWSPQFCNILNLDRDLSSETWCSFVGDISVSQSGSTKWPGATQL